MKKALLPVLCMALVVAAGCGGSPTTPPVKRSFSFTYLTVGSGATAVAGSRATVNYALWLYDTNATDHKGQFMESGTFPFVLGTNAVIKGFDQGTTGMAVGGKRRVIVPPSLGYGAVANGP